MGSVSAFLTVWDCYNSAVIQRMGMAWDTGPPAWPYQTPDILLHLLNGPALLFTFGLTSPKQHLVWYPTAVLMWWGIGKLLDEWSHALTSRRRYGMFVLLLALSACFASLSIAISVDVVKWFHDYGWEISFNNTLFVMRLAAGPLWCSGIALFAAAGAVRALRLRAAE